MRDRTPDALDLAETLDVAAGALSLAAGSILTRKRLRLVPDEAHIRDARKALTDGLKAIEEYERDAT